MNSKKYLLAAVLAAGCFCSGCVQTDTSGLVNEYQETGDAWLNDGSDIYSPAAVKDDQNDIDSMLVYSADVSIETEQYDQALGSLKEQVAASGGYFEHSWSAEDDSSFFSDEDPVRWFSGGVRIPKKQYQEFLDGLDKLGNVSSLEENIDNITESYNNTEDQLGTLRLQQDALQKLMEKAENVSDLIEITDRLAQVQSQIDQLETRKNSMNKDVQYTTIQIHLQEVLPKQSPLAGPWKNALHACTDTWVRFLSGLGVLCTVLLYLLPWLVSLAAIIFVCKYFSRTKARQEVSLDLSNPPVLPKSKDSDDK